VILSALAIVILARQPAGWQLATASGPATFRDGIATVRGGGIATYRLPSTLGGSWRVAFSVRRPSGIAGKQQYVFVSNVESLLRLAFTQGPTCYAHLYREDNSVHVAAGDDWHAVELYDVRGALTLRWDGKVQQTTQVSSAPTSIALGSASGNQSAIEVQLKDLVVDRLDQALNKVPGDVPVFPSRRLGEKALASPIFDFNAKPPVFATDEGDVLVTGNNLVLTAPPLVEVALSPGRLPPGFDVHEVGVIVDGILAASQKIPDPDLPLPSGAFDMGPSDLVVYNAAYDVADNSGNEFAVQRIHVVADVGLPRSIQVTQGDNDVLLSTKLPATALYIFQSGVYLGKVKVVDGSASVPETSLPSGDNRWVVVASDDRGNFWGPIPIRIQLRDRVQIAGQLLPSPVPGYRTLALSLTPETGVPGTSMRLLVNHQVVQQSSISPTRRLVLIGENSVPARVEVRLVQESGDAIYGGTASVTVPEPRRVAIQNLVRNLGGAAVSIQDATVGSSIQGAGFLFSSSEYVATCYHVVRSMSAILVRFPDGRTIPVSQVFFDRTSDLAILKLSAPANRPSLQAIAPNGVAVGLDANLLSPGDGGSAPNAASLSQGMVTAVRANGDIEFSGPLNGIYDGAALVGDDGALLGVVSTAGDTRVAISAQTVRRLLKSSVP